MKTETSIIIRTLNEERHLGRLMEGIQRQGYKDWEIVLVDSGSTDATLDIARRYTENIYHIPQEEFTFGRSLNLGCEHATGRYLVFASAHVYPVNNTWLGNLTQPFEDPLVAMVYGRQRGVERSRISEERDLERLFASTSKILIDEPFAHNGNSAIRKDLWQEQPFDERLPGLEDIEWARKIQRKGYRVTYAANAGIYHTHEESLRQVYRRMFREGLAYRRIFPGFRIGKVELIKGLTYNMAADFLYAIRRRKPVSRVVQIPATRVSGHLGVWKGLHYHDKPGQELLAKLQYSNSSESVVIRAPSAHGDEETNVGPLGPEDVLINLAYIGVCDSDSERPVEHLGQHSVKQDRYSLLEGHEYSGVVVAVGTRVRGLHAGDKVVGNHTMGGRPCTASGGLCFSEEPKHADAVILEGKRQLYLQIQEMHLRRLPRGILLKEGALLQSVGICLSGLRRLGNHSGGTACVIGAGPMGNFCAQILRRHGASVTVVEQDERWLRLLYKYDVDVQKNLGMLDSFDYVIDTTTSKETRSHLPEKTGRSAKVLFIGSARQESPQTSVDAAGSFEREVYRSTPDEDIDWTEATRLISTGAINLDDHTATVLPVGSSETGLEPVGEHTVFKVLLLCNPLLDGF